jgi:hypothetical protein
MNFDFNKLPKGISGAIETPELVGQFKSACYLVARETGFSVKAFWGRGKSKTHNGSFTYDNYHATYLEAKELSVWTLCNAIYPVVAFTEETAFLEKEFVDNPLLAKTFSEITEFLPLDVAYLNQRVYKGLESNLLSLLDEQEIHNIRHWTPKRVGDIIFNEWD